MFFAPFDFAPVTYAAGPTVTPTYYSRPSSAYCVPRTQHYNSDIDEDEDDVLEALYEKFAQAEQQRREAAAAIQRRKEERQRQAYLRALEAEHRRQQREREEEEFRRAWLQQRAQQYQRQLQLEEHEQQRRLNEIAAAKAKRAAAAQKSIKTSSPSPLPAASETTSPVSATSTHSSPRSAASVSSLGNFIPVRVVSNGKSTTTAPSRLSVPLTVNTAAPALSPVTTPRRTSSGVLIEDEVISPEQLNLDPEDFVKADRCHTPTVTPSPSRPASPKPSSSEPAEKTKSTTEPSAEKIEQ